MVDPRARFAQPARFPDAEEVVAAWPEEAFAQLGGIDRATAIAVLTHDPKLDDAALIIALRSQAGYIGAMGSRRAQDEPPRAAARQGGHRRGAGAHLRADRARPRRADRRGDRALDHGRDRRDALRPRRRAAGARQGPDPRGRRVKDRRAGPRRRRGLPVRRRPSSSPSCGGRPLLELRASRRCWPCPRSPRGGRARPRRRRDPRGGRPAGTRASSSARTGGRARRRRCAAGVAALGDVDAAVVTLGDQPFITPQVIAAVLDRGERRHDAVRATYGGRPGHPVAARRARCSTRAGELRGDVGFRDLLEGQRVRRVRGGAARAIRRTSTRGRSWRGYEARAVIRGAGPDRRRCGRR